MKYTGKSVYLRDYDVADAAAKLSFQLRNRAFFQQYLYTRDDSFYSLEAQIADIEDGRTESDRDQKYSFGIFLIATDELIGGISLFEIERGFLQKCMIGYSLNQTHNGKGYMTEAIGLAIQFAFAELRFHRIEAGVMPRNLGSIRALEKAGFQKEGLARKNVKINGQWENHLMFAILDEDVRPTNSEHDVDFGNDDKLR